MILAGPFWLLYIILFYSKSRLINTSKVTKIARALCYIESTDTLYYQSDKTASHSDKAGQQQFRELLLECSTRHKFTFSVFPCLGFLMLCQKDQRQQLWQMQEQAASLKHHWLLHQITSVMIPDLFSLSQHTQKICCIYIMQWGRADIGWSTPMFAVIHFKCALRSQFDLVYSAYKQINRQSNH